jgi:hypothetical protein
VFSSRASPNLQELQSEGFDLAQRAVKRSLVWQGSYKAGLAVLDLRLKPWKGEQEGFAQRARHADLVPRPGHVEVSGRSNGGVWGSRLRERWGTCMVSMVKRSWVTGHHPVGVNRPR